MSHISSQSNNNEPRPIGEVIKDLIREGLILPKYKSNNK